MRRELIACLLTISTVSWTPCVSAGEQACTCERRDAARAREPACQSTWTEKKTKKPEYSMKCEYACGRAYDCWCNDPAECRCRPPDGKVYVKKKLYKSDGKEKVEKVPKYEVTMVPAAPCDCARCCNVCWWNPLSVLHYLVGH
jgi:hypothetical protein